ncbi:MAG: hypothetical protein Q7K16_00040 [Candidatus Azambacteria bacterium]|nr:hypothetical protein [Candidatus Azambacteria bacterium]
MFLFGDAKKTEKGSVIAIFDIASSSDLSYFLNFASISVLLVIKLYEKLAFYSLY